MQTEQAICKIQNGELGNEMGKMQRIRVGMRGIGWESGCEGMQLRNARNLDENAKNVGNQYDNAGNQGGT